jgi:hypothetical protein
MKRIFSILLMLICFTAFSQPQKVQGDKRYTGSQIYLNVGQNDLNTKLLSLNPAGLLQWRSASSFSSTVPNFQSVTNVGYTTSNPIVVNDVMLIKRSAEGGVFIGKDLTTQTGNGVSIGESAGFGRLTNNFCTFLGNSAGYNSTGDSNVFLGNYSGQYSNGGGNIFIGGAGAGNSGNYNVSVGGAGSWINSGSHTIGLGYRNLYNNTFNNVIHLSARYDDSGFAPATNNHQFVISTNTRYIRINTAVSSNVLFNLVSTDGTLPVINTTAPESATATGKYGEIRIAADYIYLCIAANTWVRSAVATW